MKQITLTICSLTMLFSLSFAQSEKEMKAWSDYMTPSPVHKMIAKYDGDWNEEISMWMTPGAPVQKNTATCTNKMVLNGLYQESVHTGNFNGMPFEGHSTIGFDNAKKKFFSTWIDNMGSGISYMEGNFDEASKTLTMKGKMVNPTTGKEEAIRQTCKMIDDDNQFVVMYNTGPDGKEFKSMEIKLTRKK